MVMLCVAANAQNKNYHRVYFGYTPAVWTGGRISEFGRETRYWDGGTATTHGFHFGYFYGANLTKKLPLYLEFGGGFQYNNKKDKTVDFDDDVKYTLRSNLDIFQMVLPVQVTYRFKIGNKGFKIAPYVGLTPKFNLVAKDREKISGGGESASKTYNLYDYEDTKPNVFQLAGQVGCTFYYKKLTAAFGIMTDFSPAWSSYSEIKDIKDYKKIENIKVYSASYSTTFSLTVGYQF